jgi:hypothetical protein
MGETCAESGLIFGGLSGVGGGGYIKIRERDENNIVIVVNLNDLRWWGKR